MLSRNSETEYSVEDVLAYDKAVDKAKAKEYLEFDLPQDKQKVAQSYAKSKVRAKGVYTFDKRERKPDNDKRFIIKKIAEKLTENVENLSISNAEREISFDFGGNNYSITLIKHRK